VRSPFVPRRGRFLPSLRASARNKSEEGTRAGRGGLFRLIGNRFLSAFGSQALCNVRSVPINVRERDRSEDHSLSLSLLGRFVNHYQRGPLSTLVIAQARRTRSVIEAGNDARSPRNGGRLLHRERRSTRRCGRACNLTLCAPLSAMLRLRASVRTDRERIDERCKIRGARDAA